MIVRRLVLEVLVELQLVVEKGKFLMNIQEAVTIVITLALIVVLDRLKMIVLFVLLDNSGLKIHV